MPPLHFCVFLTVLVFQCFFYNVREPGVSYQHANMDPTMLQHANVNNPDPERLYPVAATGFEDLKKRADMQDKQTQKHLGGLRVRLYRFANVPR